MAELQNIAGLKELQAALKELPDRIAKNVLRGSVNAGASVITNEVQTRAPVYTGEVSQGHPPPGTLKRAVYQKQIRELSGQLKQTFYVGVRKGKQYQKQGKKGNLSQDAWYAKFVEFGTSKMAARPFMRPAFEAKKSEAVEAIKAYLEKRIPEEVAKLKVYK
ncbi:HK97-gp10 family putative phage morphogenesis protein [Polaromonas jejuensis]|uniref:HK97-gp10 family putative phage morphogenesis protein n=1 Tax=Polaromonas jejuensis TaxID=457502 RepID=A0ABW0QHF1_9BURK|nr:HK97-gp10 family putative phage morphogenesis protein [Polaromonas jejuensis]